MVDYKLKKLEEQLTYKVTPLETESLDLKVFERTVKNLNSMLATNRPVTLVSPVSSLSKDEEEEYRKFFCKKAKEEKMNFVYFAIPVEVEIANPLEGTMFDF